MKKWILLGLLLVIVVGSAVTIYILSQPSGKVFTDEEREAKMEKLLGRDVAFTNTTPQGDTYYDGKTISFEYPAKAEIYEYRETSTSKDSNALDNFSFDLRNPRAVFNFKVAPSKEQSLDDVPAVKLRESRLEEYKKEESMLDGMEGVFYYKEKDGPEISAFYLQNGNLYTISITGSGYDHIKELFDQLLTSAKLKE